MASGSRDGACRRTERGPHAGRGARHGRRGYVPPACVRCDEQASRTKRGSSCFRRCGKTIICRDVERECLNLLQMFVEERLKHVDFVRLCPTSQETGIPLALELGQGAVAVEVDRPQVVDVVDRGVLGVLRVRIVDHTKTHTTSENPT